MSQPDPEQQRKKREQRAEQLRDEMPIELRVEKFNELLAEHNISAFSTFERESPKLEKDERFLLVRVKCILENGTFARFLIILMIKLASPTIKKTSLR